MPVKLRSLHAGAARRLLLHAGAAVRFHSIRGGCLNGKFQNLSPPSVLLESSLIFLQYTGDRCKKMMDQNSEIEFCDFLDFFKFSKKASHGPSAADLDHYGRGQTRSQWGPCE